MWLERTTAAVRRHAVLLAVLATGLALRIAMLVAYPYAFYTPDSRQYVLYATLWRPYPVRPNGYSMFLKPFVPGPMDLVAVVQHAVGLGLVVAGYAFLVHRGVRRWLAALAVLPVAIDARMLVLEHHVLAETLFTALVAAGLLVLAWPDRTGVWPAALAGALLASAALTRSVGLPLLGLALAYVLARPVRVGGSQRAGRRILAGWRTLAAFALPVVLLLGGYLVWYHHAHGVYAFGQYQGRFLYARVTTFVDCQEPRLTPSQRDICPTSIPPGWDERPDLFVWSPTSPANQFHPGVEGDRALADFAQTVIRAQPGDYLLMIAEETGWHLLPRPPVQDTGACLANRWLPPSRPGASCQAYYYFPTQSPADRPATAVAAPDPLRTTLHGYGSAEVTAIGPLYAVILLLTVAAALIRPRRPGWRYAADALLLVGSGFALIVVSVATSMFDVRYAVPAVFLLPVGGALAVHRLITIFGSMPRRR